MIVPWAMERTMQYRVFVDDKCWKCCERDAQTRVGLCEECRDELRDDGRSRTE